MPFEADTAMRKGGFVISMNMKEAWRHSVRGTKNSVSTSIQTATLCIESGRQML